MKYVMPKPRVVTSGTRHPAWAHPGPHVRLTKSAAAHKIKTQRIQLPPRSTAGQLTLDQHIGVRIPGGQPNLFNHLRGFFFPLCLWCVSGADWCIVVFESSRSTHAMSAPGSGSRCASAQSVAGEMTRAMRDQSNPGTGRRLPICVFQRPQRSDIHEILLKFRSLI